MGIACKKTGRDFIGIEIDEKYFTVAETRINQTEKDQQETLIYKFEQMTVFM